MCKAGRGILQKICTYKYIKKWFLQGINQRGQYKLIPYFSPCFKLLHATHRSSSTA